MKKLVVYLTASYSNADFTIDACLSLAQSGVDMIELGVPFSDPLADGEIIEKANLEALKKGFCFNDLYKISSSISSHVDTLWMGYMNPFYQKGINNIINEAKINRVSGLIIPDLPHEESLYYKNEFEKNGLSLIDFIAPTHSKERIKLISKNSKKFIYLVAYAGITGSGREEDLRGVVDSIKDNTNTPVYVGFGVNRDTARKKSENVDGVIVGSAFVKIILDYSLTSIDKISRMCALAKDIKESINS